MDSSLIGISLLLSIALSGKAHAGRDNVDFLIQAAGFRSEIHDVETEDGYRLRINRVLPSANVPRAGPVFLMHGLILTGTDWVVTGAGKAPAFLLAENGYDVWIGNSRGTDNCLNHRNLSSTSKEFWEFSMHEIGIYDVRAMLDYMLAVTGAARTFYIGHSQGAGSILVLLTMRPEYNQRIIQAHLMAPAAFLKNFPKLWAAALLKIFPEVVNQFAKQIPYFDFVEMLIIPRGMLPDPALCSQNFYATMTCKNTYGFLCGDNGFSGLETELETLSIMPVYMAHQVSLKQFVYFMQLVQYGYFAPFNYDQRNPEFYNATTPPEYNLNNFRVPTYLYTAGRDTLVGVDDILTLASRLPNVRKNRKFDNYNHCDFNYGRNSRADVFAEMLQDMNSAI